MNTRDLSPLERTFFRDMMRRARRTDFSIELVPTATVAWCGYRVQGYVGYQTRELVVATGSHPSSWFQTLVHEWAHVDQMLERSVWWKRLRVSTADVDKILVLWTEKKIELSQRQVVEYVTRVRDLEWDCEKRTVRYFVSYGMDIDTEAYIQQANAYIYSFTMAPLYRCLLFGGISTPALYRTCPTRFLSRHAYAHVPKTYRTVFHSLHGKPRH